MTQTAYQACLEKIYKLGRFGIKLELETIENILAKLGNPHKNYKIVHVAGTNGKGSTAAYIASILQTAGFKTGVYPSPHLIRFNERICIDREMIADDDVVAAYEAVHAADTGERKATFFEIATAMGFYHFAQQKVDWAVIETGMGGRFDATNIVSPEVCVITNLSIEHTDYLGHTIKALATEKGGIIKASTPVVTAVNQPSGLKKLKEIAQEKSAPLYRYKHDFSMRKIPGKSTYIYRGLAQTVKNLVKPLPGDHQKENLSLALAACELIFQKENITRTPFETCIKEGLSGTRWPGRLEVVMENPLVILDGAHNLKAAQVLGNHLKKTLNGRKLTLVVGILDDKPYQKMLEHLVPKADRIIVTRAKIDRSLGTDVLSEAIRQITDKEIAVIDDVKQAVSHAISNSCDTDAVCVAGSLYVTGEAKEKFDLDFI